MNYRILFVDVMMLHDLILDYFDRHFTILMFKFNAKFLHVVFKVINFTASYFWFIIFTTILCS